MSNSDEEITSDLVEELQRHLHAFRLLYSIILKQRGYLRTSDLKGLYTTKRQKERVVEIIKARNAEVQRLHQQWFNTNASQQDRERVREVVMEINRAIKKIFLLEGENELLVDKSKDKILKQLTNLFIGTETIREYLPQIYLTSRAVR